MMYVLSGFKPRAKARPRADSRNGRMFLPTEYTDWKDEIRAYLALHYRPTPTLAPCSLEITLLAPKQPRGDLDNLAGGLMDAIQPPRAKGDVRAQQALERVVSIEDRMAAAPGCLIGDDAQIVRLVVEWKPSKQRGIALKLEEVKHGT